MIILNTLVQANQISFRAVVDVNSTAQINSWWTTTVKMLGFDADLYISVERFCSSTT